jgi:hypothetical protein
LHEQREQRKRFQISARKVIAIAKEQGRRHRFNSMARTAKLAAEDVPANTIGSGRVSLFDPVMRNRRIAHEKRHGLFAVMRRADQLLNDVKEIAQTNKTTPRQLGQMLRQKPVKPHHCEFCVGEHVTAKSQQQNRLLREHIGTLHWPDDERRTPPIQQTI